MVLLRIGRCPLPAGEGPPFSEKVPFIYDSPPAGSPARIRSGGDRGGCWPRCWPGLAAGLLSFFGFSTLPGRWLAAAAGCLLLPLSWPGPALCAFADRLALAVSGRLTGLPVVLAGLPALCAPVKELNPGVFWQAVRCFFLCFLFSVLRVAGCRFAYVAIATWPAPACRGPGFRLPHPGPGFRLRPVGWFLSIAFFLSLPLLLSLSFLPVVPAAVGFRSFLALPFGSLAYGVFRVFLLLVCSF